MFELITLPNTYYQATEKLYTTNDHQALFAVGAQPPNGHQTTNGVPLTAPPPPPPPTQFAPPPHHHQQPPPPQPTSNGSINSAAILAAAAQALVQAQNNSIIAAAAQHSSQSSSPTNGTPNGQSGGQAPNGLGSSSHNSIHESSHSHSSSNTSPSNSIHQHVAAVANGGGGGAPNIQNSFFLGTNPQNGCFSIPTGVPGTEPSNAGKCQHNDSVRKTNLRRLLSLIIIRRDRIY